jgi:hypothetical protein
MEHCPSANTSNPSKLEILIGMEVGRKLLKDKANKYKLLSEYISEGM